MVAKAKLTEEQKTEIRARFAAHPNLTKASVGKEYGVDATTITRLLAASAPTIEENQPAPGALLYRLADIRPSPLNPRKTFDEEEIEQLAASIKSKGLLQNIVLRAMPDGTFAIVAGERRFRALTRLAERGEWDPEALTVPGKVIEADDAEHLATALLENLQRKDPNPMEEAEAFAQLQAIDPEKWSPRGIAEAIGMTTRHVQLRLAMVNKLSETLKAKLRDGKMTIAHARVMSMLPIDMQDGYHFDLEHMTAVDLANRIKSDMIPVDRAHFDLDKYKGVVIEDGDGNRYFASKSEFKKAQAKSAKDLANGYMGNGKWAFTVVTEDWYGNLPWKYEESHGPSAGVVILITQGAYGPVKVFEGVTEKKNDTSREAAEWKILNEARQRLANCRAEYLPALTSALSAAIARNPAYAMQLVIFDQIARPTPYTPDKFLRCKGGISPKHFAPDRPLSFLAPFMDDPGKFNTVYGADMAFFANTASPFMLWQVLQAHTDISEAFSAAIAARLVVDVSDPLCAPLLCIADAEGIEIPAEIRQTEKEREEALEALVAEIMAERGIADGQNANGDDEAERYADFSTFLLGAQPPETEAEVIEQLRHGLNILLGRPEDAELGLFVPLFDLEDDLPTTLNLIDTIDELFNLDLSEEESDEIALSSEATVGDAVGFICEKLRIEPTIIKRATE